MWYSPKAGITFDIYISLLNCAGLKCKIERDNKDLGWLLGGMVWSDNLIIDQCDSRQEIG